MNQEQLRVDVTRAIHAMDQGLLNRCAFTAGLNGWQDVQEAATHRALSTASHTVQQFWLGECGWHRDEPQVRITMGAR